MFIDVDKHPSDINDWLLIDQYEHYFKYYSKLYNPCSVMFQNGTFWEFYGVETDELKIGNVSEISSLTFLNIACHSTLNKNTRENPLFVGVPMVSKSKYIGGLVKRGWTIVQVDQEPIKSDKKKKFKRGVSAIHSPGTYIDYSLSEADNNFIISIYIEAFTDPEYDPVAVGLCSIDVSTGETEIYETYNNKDDQNYAFDDITRFIQTHSPKEIIFYSTCSFQEFKNNINWNEKYSDQRYQTRFLEKIYNHTGLISIQEYLGISRFTTATASFIALLQYCLDHNPILLEDLSIPRTFDNDNYLILTNNAISQLDLLCGKESLKDKTSCIFNLVNFTQSGMGHRLLQQRLLLPITNIEEIKYRHVLIAECWDYSKYDILKKICDLEKACRKITNIKGISVSLFNVEKLTEITEAFKLPKIKKLLAWLKETVDPESDTLFISDELRKQNKIKKKCLKYFNTMKEEFDRRTGVDLEMLLNEEDGCRFKFSKTKYILVKEDVIELHKTASYHTCTTTELKQYSEEYSQACLDYAKEYKRCEEEFISTLSTFKNSILSAALYVAQVDIAVSSAKCAQLYNYVKPKIVKGDSFLIGTQLRHPLIERISNTIYTPHDISLTPEHQGMLLYGFNASGKSSLMKTIGVNLILAQAGLYVAASYFKFSPFKTIQTRIISNDNLQKGLSSFAVEMTELRGILSRANGSSLILGDEISRGTETISGVAIVSSAVVELINKGAYFLFATHLHQLVDMEEIKELKSLGIYHLQVERDKKTGTLIYKRDLQPGSGDSLYGLEVARAMKLPQEFLDRAMNIRKKLVGDRGLFGKPSRYNSEMFLKNCGVCGNEAVEVHHIRFQSEANDNGYIDHFHKNNLMNLVGLCEKCHTRVHQRKLTIDKWRETSNGVELVYH